MDLEKIKEFIIEKKIWVIGIIVLILGGGYFIQKNNQPAVNNTQVLSENNKTQSTEFSKSENKTTQSTSNLNSSSKQNTVTVDIAGAVKHSGVYTLKNGARLNDLLEICGGLTDKAETRAINRAALLKDQDQIYVPHIGEKVENLPGNGTSNSQNPAASDTSSSSSEQVHLNSATVQDLQKLNGVGQKKAEQIIAYRDQNGGFKQIEDLTKVTGIGEKTFEKLKDQLAL